MATFHKGDAVTYFSTWDNKGTARVVDLTVHAAGKKRMTLVDANGQKFEGRFFAPTVEQDGLTDACNFVLPRQPESEAHATGIEFALRILKAERDRLERLIAMHETNDAMTGYVDALRRELAQLHEPRVRYEGGVR